VLLYFLAFLLRFSNALTGLRPYEPDIVFVTSLRDTQHTPDIQPSCLPRRADDESPGLVAGRS
jgi:hypothetical protein